MPPKINSRQKGKRVEREAAEFLRRLGFEGAKRGQQHSGSPDSPDVLAPGLAVHLEVKGVEAIDLGLAAWHDAIKQAQGDAGERPWAVLWKRNRTAWRLTCTHAGLLVTVTGDEQIRKALQTLHQSRLTRAGSPAKCGCCP